MARPYDAIDPHASGYYTRLSLTDQTKHLRRAAPSTKLLYVREMLFQELVHVRPLLAGYRVNLHWIFYLRVSDM